MSQYDFGTIDPYVDDGVTLADMLNNWRDAVHSMHRGATRPSYAVPGMTWVNNSAGPTSWLVKVYLGPSVGDMTLFAYDTTTGAITIVGGGGPFLPLTGGNLSGALAILMGGANNASLVVHQNDASSYRPVLMLEKNGIPVLQISGDGTTPGITYYEALGANGQHLFIANGVQVANMLPGGIQLFGNPIAPTAAAGDNDTSIATTAFVQAADKAFPAAVSAFLAVNTALTPAGSYVSGPSVGPVGAAGQIWRVDAGMTFSQSGGSTFDYYTSRIWTGSAMVGPEVTCTSGTGPGFNQFQGNSGVITLSGATTFSLQAKDGSGFGQMIGGSWITAQRVG